MPVKGLWQRVKDKWHLALYARISFAFVAVGIAVLFLPQGRDVVQDLVDTTSDIRAYGDRLNSGVWWRWLFFLLACIWSGINAWYWPALLAKTDKTLDTRSGWFVGLRRLLGLAPLGAGLLTIWKTDDHCPKLTQGWMLTFALAFAGLFAFMWLRQRRFKSNRWATPAKSLGGRSSDGMHPVVRGDVLFFWITSALGLVLFALLCIPGLRTTVAWRVGSAALAFVAVGIIISTLSALTWTLRAHKVSLVWTGIALFTLSALIGNDNHEIRGLGPAKADGAWLPINAHNQVVRPSVDQAYMRWQKRNPSGPVILVATAGGASRAAYWTSVVLRALDDQTRGQFSQHVFAISSVSGGSLGAIGYAAWVANQNPGGGSCPFAPDARTDFDRAFFGADFLSPAVAGLLFPDAVQRFLPGHFVDDRSVSIEEAFEMAWRRSFAGQSCVGRPDGADMMAGPFDAIWSDSLRSPNPKGWVPLVFANGTMVENGKRVITAPVGINPGIFEDSYDFFALTRREIRASTAVMNSARFPIVSPAGSMIRWDEQGHRQYTGRIVDGGYFENGGLETLSDLARHLALAETKRAIIVIEINNDDESANETTTRYDLARHPNPPGAGPSYDFLRVDDTPATRSRILPEIGSIISAMYQTRSSRGVLAAKRFSQAERIAPDAHRFTFNLGPVLPHRRTAMSWSVSSKSRAAMDKALSRSDAADVDTTGLDREQLECQIEALDQIALALGYPFQRDPHQCPANSISGRWVGVQPPLTTPATRRKKELRL